MVALDRAGKTLAVRGSGHIHHLADLEQIHTHLAPERKGSELLLRDAEFLQRMTGLDRGFGEMAGGRLVDARGATLAESDLYRNIAIGLRRLDLGHAVVGHVHHGHRDGVAVVSEYAGHADLATD